MKILISNSSKEPIYNQISAQIKDMIIKGELKAGDSLPSMRFLAKELRISVITTKRAYEELERDGFIESYTGRGSFVKEQNQNFLKEAILKDIESALMDACNKAKKGKISYNELEDILKIIYYSEE